MLLHLLAVERRNRPVLRAPSLRRPAAPVKAKVHRGLQSAAVNPGLSAGYDFDFALSHIYASSLAFSAALRAQSSPPTTLKLLPLYCCTTANCSRVDRRTTSRCPSPSSLPFQAIQRQRHCHDSILGQAPLWQPASYGNAIRHRGDKAGAVNAGLPAADDPPKAFVQAFLHASAYNFTF